MPVKTTKTTSSKSNVAHSKGKAGLLSKKVKFNWRIVAVIGVVLVAALGYLFVRLSEAGTTAYKRWYVESFQNFAGEATIAQAVDGSFPVRGWLNISADLAGFRIPHTNQGAGQYCLSWTDLRRGGGEPVFTLKVYGVNGSNKALVKTVTNNAECITVTNDIATYPNREFEFSVVGGSAPVGSVTFIPAVAADGKGTFWLSSQMRKIQPQDYGTLVTSSPGAQPEYRSEYVSSKIDPNHRDNGEYLFLEFDTDSVVAAEYCVEGYAPKGSLIAIDASGAGARDVQYEALVSVDGGLQFKKCKTLTPANGATKVQLYLIAPGTAQEGDEITVYNAYRNPVPVAGSKNKR